VNLQAAFDLDPELLRHLFLIVKSPFPTRLLQDVSFVITIPLDTHQISPYMMNQVAHPPAKLQGEVTLASGCRRYDQNNNTNVELSMAELSAEFITTNASFAVSHREGNQKYEQDFLVLWNDACGMKMQFPRPCSNWTLQAFVDCILSFETHTRPKYHWFGGIDVHHVYFESGMTYSEAEKAFSYRFGS
jgi:hypothetical protein